MNFPHACFVAGTDTGAGKTLATCALLHALSGRGRVVAGIKPVAAGADRVDGRDSNGDARALLAASTLPGLDIDTVNPVLLPDPLSPHIAAGRAGVALQAGGIAAQVRERLAGPADHYLVEGAGGWLAPLGERETMADLARALGLPVVLVVGLRLGCLNHALLTATAIDAAGLPLFGWIASQTERDMQAVEENLATLAARLPGRMLGNLPWQERPDPAELAGCIVLDG